MALPSVGSDHPASPASWGVAGAGLKLLETRLSRAPRSVPLVKPALDWASGSASTIKPVASHTLEAWFWSLNVGVGGQRGKLSGRAVRHQGVPSLSHLHFPPMKRSTPVPIHFKVPAGRRIPVTQLSNCS
ncbi:hypothetical protein E2C01_023091 [Portunus trituberculatus]|uniref:Uncharacterized protein n=1 Tax=Portunus trituberculatus TaxID=210409 RepID=A0A5B7E736_PORTR|nr:hypothetical protein [Portunus trituberculatus]